MNFKENFAVIGASIMGGLAFAFPKFTMFDIGFGMITCMIIFLELKVIEIYFMWRRYKCQQNN